MTIHEASQRLLFQLYHVYDNSEAINITDRVMEHISGWKKIDRIINKTVSVSVQMELLLEKFTTELLLHRPVQYVLGEAWFFGMKFFVNEHVLIPRPETEELVDWIISYLSLQQKNIRILDVGTGSGCIAVSIKKKWPESTIYGCDISKEALEIAEKNAMANDTKVNLLQMDILNKEQRKQLPSFDLIVSNPPYIPKGEKTKMNDNVVKYEPHIALFVEDKDPFVFYHAIADMPVQMIFCEMHEEFTRQTTAIFISKAFKTEIRKDMQGKERMLKAWL